MKLHWLQIVFLVWFPLLLNAAHFSEKPIYRHDKTDSSKIYNNLGTKMYRKGDFESSKTYFLKSIQLKKEKDGEEVTIANSLLNLGVINRTMWQYDEAIRNYNVAEEIFKKNFETNRLALVLFSKANVYADLGDFEKAIEQYKQALHILNEDETINIKYISAAHNNLGSTYMEMGDYSQALKAFKESLKYAEVNLSEENKITYYKNLAGTYLLLDSMKKAEEYYNKGIQHFLNDDGFAFQKGYFYLDYGKYLLHLNDSAKGYSYILKAGNIIKKIYGGKHPDVAQYYMEISDIFMSNHNYEMTLDYLQKALVALVPNFDTEVVYKNPPRTNQNMDMVLLGIFKRKSNAILKGYNENPDIKLLASGYNCALTGIEILEDLRKGYVSEKSKLILLEHERDIYPTAMLIALKLHQETEDNVYMENAFTIAERSKASILLSSIKTMEAREFGGIPKTLIRTEYNLKKNIALYDEKIYEESKQNNPDSNKLKFWETKAYGLKNQYYDLIDTFEKNYPDYYDLKYKRDEIHADDIQNILNKNETLLEYCFADQYLITFVLTKNDFYFSLDTIKPDFTRRLSELIQITSGSQLFNHESTDTEMFISNSNYLYNKLIRPHSAIIKNSSLVIIPDGQLAYLPFEVLLKKIPDDIHTKYRDLSYLIKSHPVSYVHSSLLLYKAKAMNNTVSKELLAIAPTYGYPENVLEQIPSVRQKYLDHLYPLPGSKEEVKSVNHIIGGRVFLDEEATEHNFKQNAGDFDIIHLAMHTIIDNDDPMFSKMVFTQSGDSEEDDFLNTYELYNMQLSARMVVLSSCNTGKGKLQKGEGVMSMARGFLYAGCPSVTMSFWEVEDKSGARLMEYYYSNLKKGKSKSKSLQMAKLAFLENADPLKAHPYFWSGYVVIGNHDSLFHNMKLIYSSSFAFTLLAGFLIYRHRRKFRKKGN